MTAEQAVKIIDLLEGIRFVGFFMTFFLAGIWVGIVFKK